MAYLPLSTANLPDPAIDPAAGKEPTDYFNTVLYTGNGGTNRSITGMGFQADWLWHKDRSASRNHSLVDVIRGTNDLQSNATDVERSMPSFVSFDSDGFTVTQDGSTNPNWNENSITKVVWGWKANGSGVSNTDGDISTTVSVNTESGFSIVSYTCPETTVTGDTIGHGLGVAPEFAIFRNRDFATDWGVYHKDLGNTHGILLNSTDASFSSTEWWNNTSPTSTVMSLGRFSYIQRNNDDYIAYCFHSVEGFSKVGSYTGNGSSDGPFVYTGFRPAFVLLKLSSAAGERWWLHDTAREEYNGDIAVLAPDFSGAEETGSVYQLDILSNGFKLRNSHAVQNSSGATYIYMAFAENPFKYSNAR